MSASVLEDTSILVLEPYPPTGPGDAGSGDISSEGLGNSKHGQMCRCGSTSGKGTRRKSYRPHRSADVDLEYVRSVNQRIVNQGLLPHDPVSLPVFKNLLGIEQEFYADRFFCILDSEGHGYLLPHELTSRLTDLASACLCRKFKLLFDIYDANGNGSIDQEEFNAILTRSIAGNSLSLSTQQVEYLTRTLFDAIDKDMDDVVSFDEFRAFLDSSPELLDSLQVSISRFLRPPRIPDFEVSGPLKKRHFPLLSCSYMHRHPCEFVWGWLFLVSVVAFFTYGAVSAGYRKYEYYGSPCVYYYLTAKGFGNAINWTSTLAVVFMLKESMTFVRSTSVGRFVPVDSMVYIHKVNGYVLVVAIFCHIIMHFATYGCVKLCGLASLNYSSAGETNTSTILSPTLDIISGWFSFAATLLIFTGSLPCVRRTGHFEVFFYTHLSGYVTFYIALLLHTFHHKFWQFIIVPGTMYIVEKAYASWMIHRKSGYKVMIRKVVQWPSGVTQLTVDRPAHFVYNPGDYIQIKIPALAWFEWHPFTISSCPEEKNFLTLHIRTAGDWTRRLYNYFAAHLRDSSTFAISHKPSTNSLRQSVVNRSSRRARVSIFYKKRLSEAGQILVKPISTVVHIKGPYGTPSGKIFQAQHAMLICAGIGVTPFSSILQSIVIRHRNALSHNVIQSHEPISLGNTTKLQKVDFIWVVKNQRNLEWFMELLEGLDAEQYKEERFHQFLNIQIYLTSCTKMDDLHAFALMSALETFYKKHNRDLITGIAARAKHGRPDWNTVFKNVADNRRGHVSVFYCGPHPLSRDLRRYSSQYDFRFFKESF
ncbi:NADPH oxidase 5-like [Paramacrobiotus metropolitanus]|uniref:NADPH oxidase 5-like n=1 Tax=Paramacrobiotus metropolitanus TaxID=2943436 RepID=UPI0024456AD8|nr:NADPH oxidase 5-like [Paramacrobiotus metropolitanus]